MRNQAYIVEFLGASGAGKSTLASGVNRHLLQHNVATVLINAYGRHEIDDIPLRKQHCAGIDRMWIVTVQALLLQPCLTFWCLLNLDRRGRHGILQHCRQLLTLCRCSFIVSQLPDTGIYLIDEGPNKVVTTLVNRGARLINWLNRLVPKPHFCVVLNVTPEIAIERVRARSSHGWSDEDIRKIVLDHVGASHIMRTMRALTNMVDLDTSDNSDHSVAVAQRIITDVARQPK